MSIGMRVVAAIPVGVLAGLALALPGCCDEGASTGASPQASVVGEPPQGSAVVGAAVFTGGGGVQIDLSVVDPEEPGATSAGEITAWTGSRDTGGSDNLPGPNTPPTTTPVAQSTYWNLRRMNGSENPWTPGLIETSYDTSHDQFWIYVQLRLERAGGGDPIISAYRYEWDPSSGGGMNMEEFVKL